MHNETIIFVLILTADDKGNHSILFKFCDYLDSQQQQDEGEDAANC